MIINQDALERLRNRAKPIVQSRDLSIIPSVGSDEQSSEEEFLANKSSNIDISSSSKPDVEIPTSVGINKALPSSVPAPNDDNSSSMNLETKQSTIRLEKELSQKISHKCQSEEISREVFLEALFVYFESHKSMQSKVLQEARKRDKQRQKIANYRRAKSMIERFGSD